MSHFPEERVLDLLARAKSLPGYQSLVYFAKGTWTPELFLGASQAGMTFTTKSGFWFAFNNIIAGHARVTINVKGGVPGAATISGLPFTADTNAQSGFVFSPFNATMVLLAGPVFGRIAPSGKVITLEGNAAVGAVPLTDANFANGSTVDFWFVYDALLSECTNPATGWWIPLDA